MSNRNPAESYPAYQELMAGHSPHQEIIDLSAEPRPITQSQTAPPQSSPSPTFATQLRDWTSHLLADRES